MAALSDGGVVFAPLVVDTSMVTALAQAVTSLAGLAQMLWLPLPTAPTAAAAAGAVAACPGGPYVCPCGAWVWPRLGADAGAGGTGWPPGSVQPAFVVAGDAPVPRGAAPPPAAEMERGPASSDDCEYQRLGPDAPVARSEPPLTLGRARASAALSQCEWQVVGATRHARRGRCRGVAGSCSVPRANRFSHLSEESDGEAEPALPDDRGAGEDDAVDDGVMGESVGGVN